MGKGFNNYMCKKFFHPASRDNLKRVWMAEQKSDSYKKKQEELRIQYEKEQDLYTNKAMLSKESKDKLSVNFMYEPPPGAKKEREREDNEPEYKFEWQRKFNAPREDYCKGDSEIRDQPFGIQVRNVRCIKCHKWGHINTDKECPMYNQANTSQALNNADPLVLIQQMRDDGLTIKRGVLEAQQHLNVTRKDAHRDMIPTDDEADESITQNEKQFLKSLSKKQKLKLLRKLERMESKSGKKTSKKSEDKKKKKKHKKDKDKKRDKKSAKHESGEDSTGSSQDSSDEEEHVSGSRQSKNEKRSNLSRSDERREKEWKEKDQKKKWRTSECTTSTEECEDDDEEKRKKMRKESHKDVKASNGKHRESRDSDNDCKNGARRKMTSKKKSSSSSSDKKVKKEKSSRKRKSSSDSESDSGYVKRHKK